MADTAKSLPKCVESRKMADEEALLRALAKSASLRVDGLKEQFPG
jgi:hypothetical protein